MWDTTSIKVKYKLKKNFFVLVYDEKVPRNFWRIAIVTGYYLVEILKQKGAIVRIKKAYAILKHPVNKLFPIECTYHDTHKEIRQGNKICHKNSHNWWTKEKIWMFSVKLRGRRSLWKLEILIRFNKIQARFNKTQKTSLSVIQVLSIPLTTAATSACFERVNSKEQIPKVPCSIIAASYVQRWGLSSNNPANV